MGMGFGIAPTWLRQVSTLLHKTTLTTDYYGGKTVKRWVWAWNEIVSVWWRVRVVSRWKMN